MPGVRKPGQGGRDEPVALDDQMFRILPDDGLDYGTSESGEDARTDPSGRGFTFDLDDDDDDLVAEPPPARRRGPPLWLMAAGLGALVVVGGGLWVIFSPSDEAPQAGSGPSVAVLAPAAPDEAAPSADGGPGMADSAAPAPAAPAPAPAPDLPVVRAEEEPYKVRPEDPGGQTVEDQDKLIYGRLEDGDPADGGPEVEQLLPEPARPMAPPVPEPAPEPPVTPPAEQPATAPEPAADAGPATADAAADDGIPAPFSDAAPPVPETEGADAEETASASEPAAPEPAPVPEAPPGPAAEPAPAPEVPTATAPENVVAAVQDGPQVQLAAFRERALAERHWERVSAAHPDLLGDVPHVIVFADLGDRGQFYRLRAGPLGSDDAARTLCESLKQRDVECLIVRE
ncbi:SPOR domain-containing protein [Roseospira navarrensis]|uniref:SPOR domain-containing protein n=1 Tax=Roseospira navarrensis TaxID=140058 RepID=A0A7X1ZBQ4_9PROT|nr:SPOR domain-containing protein [Roseospira navarrensis]MQX35609.1 hypothetical protein [Roseospira navarrensis]